VQSVDPLLIFIVFTIASLIKLSEWQLEHAMTRGLIAVWYLMITVLDIPFDWRVWIGGILFSLLAFIETVSYVYRKWLSGKYKDALHPVKRGKNGN
jgi:hypothetical protein